MENFFLFSLKTFRFNFVRCVDGMECVGEYSRESVCFYGDGGFMRKGLCLRINRKIKTKHTEVVLRSI